MTLAQFSDIAKVFQTFLDNGPLAVEFSTRQQATKFRQRAYTYRKKLAEELGGPTPFDAIFMRIEPDDPCRVLVMERPFEGKVTNLEGQAVQLSSAPTTQSVRESTLDADLLRIAQEVRGKVL